MIAKSKLAPTELRKRIRIIMDYVASSIQQGEAPSLVVIDSESVDESMLFSSDDCCLKINRSHLRKREINLLGSPYNFHKLLVLLDYIDRFLANNLSDPAAALKVNKRGVYYSLLGQGIKSTDELDTYITQICELVEASRLELGINASTKCLISGGGLTSEATIEYLQLPAFMQNASSFEQLGIPDVRFVVVVEKETVFSQLYQMNWFLHDPCKLLVTAKGYPDFATRQFLTLLATNPEIRMLYIGDADPFGADIFFQYLFGSLRNAINQNEAQCQTLMQLKWIGPFMRFQSQLPKETLLELSKKDQYKAY